MWSRLARTKWIFPEIFLDERQCLEDDAERRRHNKAVIELDRQQQKLVFVMHLAILVHLIDDGTDTRRRRRNTVKYSHTFSATQIIQSRRR